MGFRIFFDSSKSNLGEILQSLGKIGNVIYVSGDLYIWLNEGKGKRGIVSALKKAGVTEYYLQEITEETVSKESGFAYAWCREHLNDAMVSDFEQRHQEELNQMQANIDKAEKLLEARKRQAEMQARQKKEATED